ncbi:MAG: LON peptidase substrate-binding domain-containing protein, partial [Spirochaetia bacterium]|nr:LON peptidase substrate-binding domain-containing protein [Spirochaetia bacterium]
MKRMINYTDQNITEIDFKDVPTEAAIIPLRNAVVLPGVLLPIFVGRTESVDLIEKIGKPGQLVALFTQISPQDEEVDFDKLYKTGTLAEIHRVLPMGEGGFQVFLQGIQKIELLEITQNTPHLRGRITPVGEITDHAEERYREFQAHVVRYVENHPGIPDEITGFVRRITNPSSLANQIVFFSQKEIGEKIDFMRISSVNEKMDTVQKDLIEETNRLVMEKEVRDKVEKDAAQMQREFYLRKQMETIRKELGEDDTGETDDLEKQLADKWL